MSRFAQRFILTLITVAAAICLTTNTAQAGVIYGATGSAGIAGSLYTLDPLTGAATLIGALDDASGAHYGITGLAFDPVTGVLYGSTANLSPTRASHLVTIDPLTALVNDIGAYNGGATMSDLTFLGTVLYGYRAANGHTLNTIDLTTGLATAIPGSGSGDFGGGGLAADGSGTMYITPDASTNPPGSLQTISAGGVRTFVATLSGGAQSSKLINAMAFDGDTLYGMNVDRLVSINKTTGVITDIGLSGSGFDAIAVLDSAVPEPSTVLLVGVGIAVVALRQRKPRLGKTRT